MADEECFCCGEYAVGKNCASCSPIACEFCSFCSYCCDCYLNDEPDDDY